MKTAAQMIADLGESFFATVNGANHLVLCPGENLFFDTAGPDLFLAYGAEGEFRGSYRLLEGAAAIDVEWLTSALEPLLPTARRIGEAEAEDDDYDTLQSGIIDLQERYAQFPGSGATAWDAEQWLLGQSRDADALAAMGAPETPDDAWIDGRAAALAQQAERDGVVLVDRDNNMGAPAARRALREIVDRVSAARGDMDD